MYNSAARDVTTEVDVKLDKDVHVELGIDDDQNEASK